MIAIIGANGRMGKQLQQYLQKINRDYVGIDVNNRNQKLNDIDGIIDFSSFEALKSNLILAKKLKVPMVIGTTNHSEENILEIQKSSKSIPIFLDSNFSLQFNVFLSMLRNLSSLKNNEFLLQEIHHKTKKDTPSGSAKKIIEQLQRINIDVYTNSIRIADVIGEHSLSIFGESEILEIKHTAKSREIFCVGAVKALDFIKSKKCGLYNMEDLIKSDDRL